jgi:hypothetical protein
MSAEDETLIEGVAVRKARIPDPKFEDAGRVHDWRNYISLEIQESWLTFTEAQREMLIRQADAMAGNEDWD